VADPPPSQQEPGEERCRPPPGDLLKERGTRRWKAATSHRAPHATSSSSWPPSSSSPLGSHPLSAAIVRLSTRLAAGL